MESVVIPNEVPFRPMSSGGSQKSSKEDNSDIASYDKGMEAYLRVFDIL